MGLVDGQLEKEKKGKKRKEKWLRSSHFMFMPLSSQKISYDCFIHHATLIDWCHRPYYHISFDRIIATPSSISNIWWWCGQPSKVRLSIMEWWILRINKILVLIFNSDDIIFLNLDAIKDSVGLVITINKYEIWVPN